MLGDCLEKMREIQDGSIDMILADPPYGMTRNRWDVIIPLDPMWEQLRRVCKPDAAMLLFSNQPFATRLVMSNPNEFRYEWIAEKANASGFLNAKKMPLRAHDNILVFYRRAPTYNPQFEAGEPYARIRGKTVSPNYGKFPLGHKSRSDDGRRYPRDVLRASNPSWGSDRGLHPTQKPVALLEYMIRTYTNPGDTVLDFCMGSGSTGVACVNTGRNFIGIELEECYYHIAETRLESWRG